MQNQKVNKVWNKQMVIDLLNGSDKAVARALWKIYQRQTADEQAAHMTTHRNGRGFTGHDASFCSDVAKRLPRYDYSLTLRQTNRIRPLMRKYWRQLLEEIELAGGQVDYKNSPNSEIAEEPEGDVATAPISEPAPMQQPLNFGLF